MPKTTEDVKNELTGLQYSLDQIQLKKINIDLWVTSNSSFSKHLIENSEKYFESRKQSQKEWEKKVTEAAGLEYDESRPFDREKVYKILGDEVVNFPGFDETDSIHDGGEGEIESFINYVGEVKKFDKNVENQLDDYLLLFPPSKQSDFHFVLDALQNFIEWAEDYSDKIQAVDKMQESDQKMEKFRTSSEFVSVCSNWLSSTVNTVLKYGFDNREEGTPE